MTVASKQNMCKMNIALTPKNSTNLYQVSLIYDFEEKDREF